MYAGANTVIVKQQLLTSLEGGMRNDFISKLNFRWATALICDSHSDLLGNA